MLPIGRHLRACVVCGYPITAISTELTVHELICLKLMPDDLPAAGTERRHGEPTATAEVEATTAAPVEAGADTTATTPTPATQGLHRDR